MPSPTNRAIIAAAGSRKTQFIIDAALAVANERVLITTYTDENLAQIIRRLQEANGVVPPNVAVMGWFSFLINQAARPYQSALTKQIDFLNSLNFVGKRPPFTPQAMTRKYYFDKSANLYRDGVADFACRLDAATGGRVVGRLERLYDCIYIDELQDLAGYDFEFLDLLFKSSIQERRRPGSRQSACASSGGCPGLRVGPDETSQPSSPLDTAPPNHPLA